jgi:2-(1,2-epoxy-1,2-dihydrophenyl)acetyl-CoA isomerase
MSNDIVLQHLDSGLLTITMNRPDRRNALNPDMTRGLVEAARRAAEDHEVRAVLLKGAGGTFCVGGDVNDGGRARAAAVRSQSDKSSPRHGGLAHPAPDAKARGGAG